jgi:hypothetical protein
MGYHGGSARSCSSFADPTKKISSDLKLILLKSLDIFYDQIRDHGQ